MSRYIVYCFVFVLLTGCALRRYQADYIEANPRVDTHSRSIELQEKKVYSFNNDEIKFDNLFDGARLNDCIQLNDSVFQISILPENEPINSSPWYAFRIVTSSRDDLWLKMKYKNSKHRYHPKKSRNGISWQEIPDDRISLTNGDSIAFIQFTPISDTSWVAAQELINTSEVDKWCSQLSSRKTVRYSELGKSKLGRPLPVLDIYAGSKRKKPIVVIMGRQHPPEITGFLALQSYVETILDSNELCNRFLNQYRVLVIPLINPDGVDLGHWRHNAGGIDLNRDWGNYNQPEIRQICDYIITASKRSRGDVLIGLDFHSTSKDIFYTNVDQPDNPLTKHFKDNWLDEIEKQIDGHTIVEEASGTIPVAVSKSWFHEQLDAVGITYEIGDNTPRDFIKTKSQVSAQAMMKLLLN